MKLRIALFAVLLATLFVALPVQARRVYLGPSPPPLPFKAYVSATATPPPSGPPPWYMDVYGSGVVTLMGFVTVYQHHVVVPAADGGVDFDGYWLWTAANGDQLFGTYAGHMPLNPAGYFEIHGYFYVDGGTGRFQHATGEGPASGVQYMDGTAELVLDGTINYW